MINKFLRCPVCGVEGKFKILTEEVLCKKCKHSFHYGNGIVNFLMDDSYTDLDNVDYDDFYSINSESNSLFDKLWDIARLPYSFSNMLELGAGTGQFSIGALRKLRLKHAVITDISSKMLTICKNKMENDVNSLRVKKILYQMNSSNPFGIAHSKFDLIVGNAIVHHLPDYAQFLSDVYQCLTNDGVALFCEPNLHFYEAFREFSHKVLFRIVGLGLLDDEQLQSITRCVSSVSMVVKYAKTESVKLKWEDKHTFSRHEIGKLAKSIGFKYASFLPFGREESPEIPFASMVKQCGGDDETVSAVMDVSKDMLPGVFSFMDPVDITPSTIWILSNANKYDRSSDVVENIWSFSANDSMKVQNKAHLILNLKDDNSLYIYGWAISKRDILFIEITTLNETERAELCTPRIDIFRTFGGNACFSLNGALNSGVDCLVRFKKPIGDSVSIAFVLDDNEIIPCESNIVFNNGQAEFSFGL